jgi:hypothetical protein
MGEEESCIQISGGESPRERDHMEYTGVDWRIIFKKWNMWVCTESMWLRIEAGGGNM